MLFAVTVMIAAAQLGHTQTFTILHSFTGGIDGAYPVAGVTLDAGGNLYGTTLQGGGPQYGTVFKLTHRNTAWVLGTLYAFQSVSEGYAPHSRVVFGPDGSLYGTTQIGGPQCNACGTVFNLKSAPTRPVSVISPWNKTTIYNFTNGSHDGYFPVAEVTFDAAGNLYGTTSAGGDLTCGIVFKLTRSGNTWSESGVYSFADAPDGCDPASKVTLDTDGHIYGTTVSGGDNFVGSVYSMSPSGSNWNETVIHSFSSGLEGQSPQAGVILDSSHNLYGGTLTSDDGGTAFELSPSGGGWAYSVLHRFAGYGQLGGPLGEFAMDGNGNLYGTTHTGGQYGLGIIFKLTHVMGGWSFTDLHDFAGGADDGDRPFTNVIIDAGGNLYGTTYFGGTFNKGTVWKLTP